MLTLWGYFTPAYHLCLGKCHFAVIADGIRSVQAYERGVALFKWPQVFDIWNIYLTKFVKRYVSDRWGILALVFVFFANLTEALFQGGKKLERARDLFEQCLETCPAKFAKSKLTFFEVVGCGKLGNRRRYTDN